MRVVLTLGMARSIFWFLCIAAGVCAVIMVLYVPRTILLSTASLTQNLRLLPETLRAMVGNGSIPPPKGYMPLIPVIGRRWQSVEASDRPPRRGFANPFVLFTYPDVSLLLFFNALVYSVFYGVTATISTLFQPTYPYLTETDTGLCFLAIGGGMLVGGVITGEILDREYQRVKRRLIDQVQSDPELKIRPEDVTKEEHFPIEYARLRLMPAFLVMFVAGCIGYGWCLQAGVNIAGPLILQIISEHGHHSTPSHELTCLLVGWSCVSIMNGAQTLLVDLAPTHGSAITACVCTGSLSLKICAYSLTAAIEQPNPLLFRRSLRLRDRPDLESARHGMDVRPPVRHLRHLLTHILGSHTLRARVACKEAGEATSCRRAAFPRAEVESLNAGYGLGP